MDLKSLFNERTQYYLTPSAMMRNLVWGLLVAGVVLWGFGFAQYDGKAVWGAYLFNLFFFFCLGLGGLAMSAIQDVVGAVWARPIKRIWEGFGAFLFVAAGMFVVFLLAIMFKIGGAGEVYSWIADPEVVAHFYGKNVWLTAPFFYARCGVILAVLVVVARWQLKQSLDRDVKFMKGDEAGALKDGELAREKLNYWSGGILIVYGVCLTFFGMDLMMSLSPLWFSTLFGGWQFAIMMQTLFAVTLVTMFALKGTKIGSLITRQQFHDCGKLMHGFTIFFAYTTYAHVLTYWYGNMPEETEYFIHRLHEPWIYLCAIIPIIAFVIPLYALIFKASKWTKWVTIPLAAMILFGQWLTNMLIVVPEVYADADGMYALVALGGFLLVLGAFLGTFFWFGKRYPMIGLADPLLKDAYEAH